jgi:hypothetical protein
VRAISPKTVVRATSRFWHLGKALDAVRKAEYARRQCLGFEWRCDFESNPEPREIGRGKAFTERQIVNILREAELAARRWSTAESRTQNVHI